MISDSISAGWSLGHDGWELQSPAGCRVFLSSGERRLIQALAAQPGVTLSRAVLSAAVSTVHRKGFRLRDDTRRVDMLVSRLRAKVRHAGDELPLISVPRQGYALSIGLNAKIPA